VADYEKVNAVAASSIEKVNGVAKSSIEKINGTTTPAAGATRWVIGANHGHVCYAAASDLTSWTMYDNWSLSGTPGCFDIAAGKDSSGNLIYVLSRDSPSGELQRSGTDVTSTADWTNIDLGDDGDLDQYRIIWCDDGSTSGVWLCVGRQTADMVYRSTDGASTWSGVDISGLTGHVSGSGNGIQAMCVGNGVVMMAQEHNIYYSSNYGTSWTSIQPFSTDEPGESRCLTYTNDSFVLIYGRSGEIRARSCADSDVTDWGNEYDMDTDTRNPSGTLNDQIMVASVGGRVAHITTNDKYVSYFDVSGKTISNIGVHNTNMQAARRAEDIATDGNGTWLIAARSGDIWRSTNNAASWTRIVDGLDGNRNLQGVCCDVLTVV
jgi:hypothetical protein